MEQNGEYLIAASREDVWSALNDPDVLGACIPGCEEIERVDDEHFDAKVKAKIGPVSAKFQVAIALANLNPPASYSLEGNVKGGAAGFGKGTADVTLAEVEAGTQLTYAVKASVGGKLAQVGSRLVDGAARKMADDFFSAFTERLSGGGAAAAATGTQADSQEIQYESSGNALIWGIAFGVLLLAILLAY